MRHLLWLSLVACSTAALHANAQTSPEKTFEQQAREILQHVPLIDGHNDVPWSFRERVANHLAQIDLLSSTSAIDKPMHTDIPRLRQGMVGAQFWSVYIPASKLGSKPGDTRDVLEQIDVVHRLVEMYPDDFALALTASDIETIFAQGKIASLIGIEGGHAIERSLAVLRMLYSVGARYMTITHSRNLEWADSATDERNLGGLSEFGREVIHEMNRLGMLVDISHVSPETMHDVLDVTVAPVIFSHSSARALTNTPRNVPDDVLLRVRENNGIVMVTFVPSFVSEDARTWYTLRQEAFEALKANSKDESFVETAQKSWLENHPQPVATLADVADHIEHIIKIAGINHVGIGGDFDGIDAGPKGLEDVSTYPDLFAELLRRGYTATDLEKIAGRNLLRVMYQAEEVAAALQKQRPPSDALIEELDPQPSTDNASADAD
jgi:membrane dipeptidase